MKISSIKVTILVDLESQMFIDIHMTTTGRHDTKIEPLLLRRNLKRFSVLIADRGYDDERIREMVRREGKEALIKRRKFVGEGKVDAIMDCGLYGKRNIIESINS